MTDREIDAEAMELREAIKAAMVRRSRKRDHKTKAAEPKDEEIEQQRHPHSD
jgi:hypothetical protein